MNFSEGHVIGQYTIRRRIGSGGMAIVYEAEHVRLGRRVALKVMHTSFQDDAEFQERFLREAKIVAQLEHPHIVTVFDFDEQDGQPYLVMSYISGHTLKWHMRKRALNLQEIATYSDAIADALTYAHNQGVLHRDVKPGNVIIDDNGTPYLTDFGLARIVAQGESSLSAGMIVGTPHYLSPEQASGTINVGPAADVYALGVMLYEMVVGQVPFVAESAHAVIHDHIYTPPPFPSELNPEVPTEVELVLMQALEKDPAERYETPNALMAAFHLAIQQSGLTELSQDRSEIAAQSMARVRKNRTETAPVSGMIESPRKQTQTVTEAEIDLGEAFSGIVGDFGDLVRQKVGPKFGDAINHAREAIRSAKQSSEDRPYMPPTEDELETQIRQRVKKRLEARKSFWGHFAVFAVINGLLFAGTAIGTGIGYQSVLAEIPPEATQQVLAEYAIGLAALQQPWSLIVTLFWASGLAAHRVQVNRVSARAEDRREKMLMKKLEIEYGQDWEATISERQYKQAEKRVYKRTCDVAGFWSHAAVFFWVNIGFIAAWQMTRQVLIPVHEYMVLIGDADAAGMAAFIDAPVPLPITLLWLIGLMIHMIVTISNRGNYMERELARERKLTLSRRTPRPNKRKNEEIETVEGRLADTSPKPVRIGADGELTNSTVEAWSEN